MVTLADVMNKLDATKPTATTLINDFYAVNVSEEQTGFTRSRIFVFSDYIELFEKRYQFRFVEH